MPAVEDRSPTPGPPADSHARGIDVLVSWRGLVPLALGLALALAPVPAGLDPDAWRYFALFVAVITGIVMEPVAPAAIGLAGVIAAAALGLVRDAPDESAAWALGGFGNATVWLIFGGYMFTMGYTETGLGKRVALHLIRLLGGRTIGLGYAIALADLALAPFTASATARSAGTIYPVIRQIPELYGSQPGEASARRIGAYLLYTALAVSFVTSSMFITALAPNTLAISIMQETVGVRVSWLDWAIGFAPVGVVLLVVTPLVIYRLYPPEIRSAPEAPRWAAAQLRELGPVSRREMMLLALVVLALALWIGATAWLSPGVTAMLIVLAMVFCGVVSWDHVIGHAQAWNVLVWFATLVTMARGLAETGFVDWLAASLAPVFGGLGPVTAVVAIVGTFFFLHYAFASITAHTASLLPVFLGIAVALPGGSPTRWALLLGYSLGLMGILTTYASGQSVIYYGSRYITRKAFWTMGLTLGVIYLSVYLIVIIPWLDYLGR